MIDLSKLSLEDLYNLRRKINHEIRAKVKPTQKQNIAQCRTDSDISEMHIRRITQKLISQFITLDKSQISSVRAGLKSVADLNPLELTASDRKKYLSHAQKLMGKFSDSTSIIQAAGTKRYFGYLQNALNRVGGK